MTDIDTAKKAVTAARRKHDRARQMVETARAELDAAIAAGMDAGISKNELVRLSGLARQTLFLTVDRMDVKVPQKPLVNDEPIARRPGMRQGDR